MGDRRRSADSGASGSGAEPRRPEEPLALPGFRSFWLSGTIGFTGLAVTTVAVDVLVIDVLGASEAQVGVVRAVQFLPYLLLGLLVGAFVDRWRRRPTLIAAHLSQALLLVAVPVLFLTGALSIAATVALLFAIGCCAVVIAAAEQSYLPDLVPRDSLVLANARLGQSITVAQTSGPALGGLLLAVVSAPVALLFGAASRVAAAVLILRIRDDEPAPQAEQPRLWQGIAEGLGFIYRHRTLAPLAISTHLWFVANSTAVTAFGVFVLRALDLSALAYGLVLTAAGVGGLAGALVAPRAAARFGEGDVIIMARTLCAATWVAAAATPGQTAPWVVVAFLGAVQLAYGFSMGVEEPSEMAYRQVMTPREMLGRVNATMRSANRTAAVLGALGGGVLAGTLGFRPTFLVVAALFAVAVLAVVLSPLRGGRSGLPQRVSP